MSLSSISSSALALIEKTLLADLTGTSSTSATTSPNTSTDPSSNSTTSQLTKDLATLLKDLASGNTTDSKSAVAKVQQDLKTQKASNPSSSTSSSPLDNLLTQIAGSLNSTNSTSGSLQDLATYLIQNGQGTGSVVNTSA